MEINAQKNLLSFKPNTLDILRKPFNLDGPGRMQEAKNLLSDWIKEQKHFVKKDYSDNYLEMTILSCKGSIERSKLLIDKMCTLRTLQPHFFGAYNIKEDFKGLTDNVCTFALPKILSDDTRIYIIKFYAKDQAKTYLLNFLRYVLIMAEYIKCHDYLSKCVLIYDLRDARVSDFVTDVDFLEIKRNITVLMEGYGGRPQKVHVITTSKIVLSLLATLKTFLKQKLVEKIQVNKSHEELHEYIPREILPKDYGGDELSIKELQELWTDAMTSEEFMEYLKDMCKAVTDESLRSRYKFNENYAGMTGTFRFLNVD